MKAKIIAQVPVRHGDPDVILQIPTSILKQLTRVWEGGRHEVGMEIDFGPTLTRVQDLETRETSMRHFGEIIAVFLPKPPAPVTPPEA